MFRQTYSGILSQGSVGIDTGTQTLTYAPSQDELYIRQSDFYLREGISRTDAFNKSLQDSLSSSETSVQESSRALSESLSSSANKGVGFVEAVSRHLQQGESVNVQETSSAQDSFQYLKNYTEDYAHSKGVSTDAAWREVLSGGIGIGASGKMFSGKVDGQMSYQDGSSEQISHSESQRASELSGFQHHLQKVKNLSSGVVASIMGSEDAKLYQDFVKSLNKTESAVDQWRTAYSKQESLSNLQTYDESENLSIHQNLNQRFVEFLREKHDGDVGKVIETFELSHNHPEKRKLINEFVGEYLPITLVTESLEPSNEIKIDPPNEEVSKNIFEDDKMSFVTKLKEKIGHEFRELGAEISHTSSQARSQHDSVSEYISQGSMGEVNKPYKKTIKDVQRRYMMGLGSVV